MNLIINHSSRHSHHRMPMNHYHQRPHMARRFYHTTQIALASLVCLMPPKEALTSKHIEPRQFSTKPSEQILKTLGANHLLLEMYAGVSNQMHNILLSKMVQGMLNNTLTKEEWEKKYMQPDVLYIYRLGQALAERAKTEKVEDQRYIIEIADMFLGYGKHFERLKKYGLRLNDKLVSSECDKHIALLSQMTSTHEFYISILTDMMPYVIFANYLLQSIENLDNNPWIEYAKKYGDLNNKYAKEKLGTIIQIANEILAHNKVNKDRAEKLFAEGFSFEEWFIRHAFSEGFRIIAEQ